MKHSIEELSAEDRKFLVDILEKDPTAVSEAEAAVLRARRDYLSPVALEKFAEVMEAKEAEVDDAPKKPNFKKMNFDELLVELESRELDAPVNPTKASMVEMLEAFEADKE